jgi:acryloyl-coenzyme A reductase
MRAVRLHAFGPPDVLAVADVPVPEPGPGEVLVQVHACGVCGQDVLRRQGQLDQKLGAVMGHELSGKVVALGAEVDDLAVGDRVAGLQRQSCGRCPACCDGRPMLCLRGRLYGEDLDGGYADYATVAASSLVRVPDGVSMEAAAIAACGIATSLHALRLADVRAGERVLVTGAGGGLGVHALGLIAALGARSVAVTSSPDKVAGLEALADDVVLADGGDFNREVRERKIRPHAVLDNTARFTLDQSLRCVAPGGAVVIVGNIENGPVDVLPAAFIVRELRLLGSKAATRDELAIVLDLLARGRIAAHIGQTLPLEDAPHAHELLESRRSRGRVVLVP